MLIKLQLKTKLSQCCGVVIRRILTQAVELINNFRISLFQEVNDCSAFQRLIE